MSESYSSRKNEQIDQLVQCSVCGEPISPSDISITCPRCAEEKELVRYERPTLSETEISKLRIILNRAYSFPFYQTQRILAQALEENAVLLKEVNEHRRARGFIEIPVIEDSTNTYFSQPIKKSKPYRHH